MKTVDKLSFNQLASIQLSRTQRLENIMAEPQWDLIVVGGGITGAGIFKLACQLGLKTLLVEQKDFAWGSSSRSSKMVHGGLRYIAQGQIKLTKESVQQRQRLLTEAPNLVTKQSFAMGHYQGQFPWPWIFNSLLWVYDLFASNKNSAHKQNQYLTKNNFPFLVPNTNEKNSKGGTQFTDAMTDDARLVLRQIQEGQQLGGHAINYCAVDSLVYDPELTSNKIADVKVAGVVVKLEECTQQSGSQQIRSQQKDTQQKSFQQEPITLKAKLVINATGAWAEELANKALVKIDGSVLEKSTQQQAQTQEQTAVIKPKSVKIRPLRGSHIIVPSWRLPVASVVAILHPKDKRPVQVYPWQDVTVIGTTDVEHTDNLNTEPCISHEEFDYLLAAVDFQFPHSKLIKNDVISTFAGVRPVIASGGVLSSSKEKRDYSIYQHAGLITVAGGKLTTFRVIAEQVLEIATKQLNFVFNADNLAIFEPATFELNPLLNSKDFKNDVIQTKEFKRKKASLNSQQSDHLSGCYGAFAGSFIQQASDYQLKPISYSHHLWAELVWAVKYEQVQHLDDLLLRRTRLGNVLPQGAIMLMAQIKTLCHRELQWNETKWEDEVQAYQQLWQSHYNLPKVTLAPNMLATSKNSPDKTQNQTQDKMQNMSDPKNTASV